MINTVLTPITEIGRFVFWWLVVGPKQILFWVYNVILAFDEILVLGQTLRLWFSFEPLFGDYNWKGRIIGFLFRGLRIAMSLIVFLALLALGLGLIVLWWLWPVVAVMMILNLW